MVTWSVLVCCVAAPQPGGVTVMSGADGQTSPLTQRKAGRSFTTIDTLLPGLVILPAASPRESTQHITR